MSRAAVGVVMLFALLACKGTSSSSSSGTSSSASPESSAGEEPVGALDGVTPAELAARAKAAGYSEESTNDDRDDGMVHHTLELESDKNYAYVTFVDLGVESEKSHAAAMGENTALVVHFDEAPSQVTAPKLRDDILAASPLDGLAPDALKQALSKLGFKVSQTWKDSEDGVTRTRVIADRKGDDATVWLFDFRAAKGEGRVAVGTRRFLNVMACYDCTKRKEGLLTDMTHRRRARKLLSQLTKP
ncbi:MAG: hypothetical protein KF718_27335 [Polyangiaceae bacterium]|nr:hypothetical protein [Polyangiaceae bacterium]